MSVLHDRYPQICRAPIVWCPKYRFQILQGKVGESAREIIWQLCDWKKIEVIEGNIQVDHVHIILSIPPKYSVSEVLGFIKGKSAIKIFDRHLDLKKRYWGRHFWAKGYCVSTVGLDEEKIRKYVKWQPKNCNIFPFIQQIQADTEI